MQGDSYGIISPILALVMYHGHEVERKGSLALLIQVLIMENPYGRRIRGGTSSIEKS